MTSAQGHEARRRGVDSLTHILARRPCGLTSHVHRLPFSFLHSAPGRPTYGSSFPPPSFTHLSGCPQRELIERADRMIGLIIARLTTNVPATEVVPSLPVLSLLRAPAPHLGRMEELRDGQRTMPPHIMPFASFPAGTQLTLFLCQCCKRTRSLWAHWVGWRGVRWGDQ